MELVSVIRDFFEQGWTGICVEPVQKNFEKLKALYQGTGVRTIRSAATDFDGEMELNVATIPGAEEWGSDVSSPTDNTIRRFPQYIWGKEVVPATTLNAILVENKIVRVDFLSIDVEGHEMSVLRGFDLRKYQPLMIVVEYSSQPERNELLEYLYSFSYFCWSDNGQDLFMASGSKWAHWQVLWIGIQHSLKSKLEKHFRAIKEKLANMGWVYL